MENVKALGVHPKWEKTRSSLLQKAEQLGYDADYAVFQVADYGVSENRERVLFVGVDSSKGSSSVFFDSIEQHKCSPPSLREVFGKVGAYGTDANPASSTAKVTVAKKPVLRGSAYSGMLVNGAGRPLNLEAVSPTLTASMGGGTALRSLTSVLLMTPMRRIGSLGFIRRFLRASAATGLFPILFGV